MEAKTAMQQHIRDLQKVKSILLESKIDDEVVSAAIESAIGNAEHYLPIEKQQIISARISVTGLNHASPTDDRAMKKAEYYYDKTYNQKQPMIHQLTPELLAVQVPMDADFSDCGIENNKIYFDSFDGCYQRLDRDLPSGNWSFLGTCSKDGIDFDAEPFVESKIERGAFFNSEFGHYQTSGWTTFYKNYLHPEPSICIPNTPAESFLSLLSSKNISLEGNIKLAIIKKKK